MRRSAILTAALLAVPAHLFAADEGGGLFAVDPGLSIWTIAVFLLLLFTLRKYAWAPILGVLDAREAGIRSAIDEAAQARTEAAALLEEHRRLMSEARKQTQDLMAQGREAGERLRKEIESKARDEADQILRRAKGEIERERDKALETIRAESVDLALSAASKLVGERLDSAADRAMIQGYLKELGSSPAEA